MTKEREIVVAESDIAIVGMAGRFPGANNIQEYWELLRDGMEGIRPLSDDELRAAGVTDSHLADPKYVRSGGVLEGMDEFDASYFGFSPKDAAIMDPQHRHFYECAVEAFEHAGHPPSRFDGAVGVFAGCGMNAYFMRNVMSNPELVDSVGLFLLRHTGNDRDFLPTGISYKLNLRGPSIAVQTACSTSLVAIHQACQSLLAGECDMALAGGVTILVPHGQGYLHRENEVHSPDGHCRPFDENSAGTVITSGVGVVLLRPLVDALDGNDTVHAVIKGSAINNDGSNKVGFLAPSVDGHADVVGEALGVAGLSAEDISYIEAHGTGTLIGDPIEIAALTKAFRKDTARRQYCRIGSVKSNIGHLDTAAGAASVIKVVESLKHQRIPASLHFKSANPNIDFESSPFRVNSSLTDWEATEGPRTAGVSSLGVGGTNAHVILQEAPEPGETSPPLECELLPISAKSTAALHQASQQLADYLEQHEQVNLGDVAHTLQIGRDEHEYRRVVACRNVDDAVSKLRSDDTQISPKGRSAQGQPSIAFMFPGGGTQYPNMGRDLYETQPVYRQAVDRCLEILRPLIDFELRELLFPEAHQEAEAAEKLQRVTPSICSIFITEYATSRLWISWGIEPAVMTGHSLGEYTAACLAGVFTLEDALRIVALRGRLVEKVSGVAMLTVPLGEDEVRGLLNNGLELAAINGPSFCLVAGLDEPLGQFKELLAEKDIECRRLRVNGASHCRLLEPILDEFRDGLAQMKPGKLERPFVSNVTGTWAREEEVGSPEYWVNHFRHTVRFSDGLATLLEDDHRLLLEVGPGHTLSSLARQQTKQARAVVSSLPHPDDETSALEFITTSLGRLWISGMDLDWNALRGDQVRRRIPLPTYPFQHQPYWIEPGAIAEATQPASAIVKQENMDDWFHQPVWKESPLDTRANRSEIPKQRWLVFLDQLGLGAALALSLKALDQDVVTVREGDSFFQFGDDQYALSPEEGLEGYEQLLLQLSGDDWLPDHIVHLWLVTQDESFRPGSSVFHHNQERGFYSLMFLAQALGEQELDHEVQITVISNDMQQVNDEHLRSPDKATVLGPVLTISHEYPQLRCRSVDIDMQEISTVGQSATSEVDTSPIHDALLNELLIDESPTPMVAIRRQIRWSQKYERAHLKPANVSRIRRGGVYLITGGLGGIGLQLAEHLAKQHQTKLILLGRSGLPDRSTWSQYLTEHTDRDPKAQKIKRLLDIESSGSSVLPLAADVANLEQMTAALAEAQKRFGSLHGVFHAAGTLSDGLIQTKQVEDVERVFSPKIYGTQLLAKLLKDEPLDFFLLFSSSSTLLGPAGQVDYTAANSFLNAFAAKQLGTGVWPVVSVNWGVWKAVGRAEEVQHRLKGEAVDEELGARLRVRQPLLSERVESASKEVIFQARLDATQDWVLDEHRTRQGTAIFPGSGYFQLIRSALLEATRKTELVFEVRNLTFVSPLEAPDDRETVVRVGLRPNEDHAFDLEVTTSRPAESVTHATAHLVVRDDDTRQQVNLEEIRTRCGNLVVEVSGQETLETDQARLLRFGPRWSALRQIHYGENEALAHLQLPDNFAEDVQRFGLHPALLDLATGFGLRLIEGYTEDQDSLYVPLAYEDVQVFGELPGEAFSHVRGVGTISTDQETVQFDVTVTDCQGRVILKANRFTLKKVAAAAAFGTDATNLSEHATTPSRPASEQFFLETYDAGIEAEEGMEALERLLAGPHRPHVVASSIDPGVLLERNARTVEQVGGDSVKFARPTLESDYAAPRDGLEKSLAEMWEELLGVDQVGINDNFFELGGHSLIAVRLFARINKQFGIEYPISTLFQASTIAQLSQIVRNDSAGDDNAPADSSARKRPAYRFAVPLREGGDQPPLFVVAGMFGNVLNLRHLALYLGQDRPIYALQARGLYGDDEPHRRFEDMAKDYLAEVREIQPSGPYYLSGFSGGGITAFEMAQQLLARGENVAKLLMLDSIPAEQPQMILENKHLSTIDRVAILMQRLRREGIRSIRNWMRERSEWKRQQEERTDQKTELTPAEFRSEAIQEAFNEALMHYRTRVFPGKVHLFRPPLQKAFRLPGGRVINWERQFVDHANFWSEFVTGGVEVHEVVGDHDSMVLEPNVRILADRMRRSLQQSDETNQKSRQALQLV